MVSFHYLIRRWQEARRRQVSPLVVWAACFALGISGQEILRAKAIVWFAGLGVVLAVLGFRMRTRTLSHILIFTAAFLAGALHLTQARMSAPESVVRLVSSGGRALTLEGRVISLPKSGAREVSYVLDEVYVRGREKKWSVEGSVQVRSAYRYAPEEGSRVAIEGVISRPEGPRKRPGVGAILKVPRSARVVLLSGPDASGSSFGPRRLERRLAKVFDRYLEDPPAAGLAKALVLGEREGVPWPVREAMVRTGTWHVMVVSGSHTAFLAGLLFILFKALPVPRPFRFGAIIGVLLLYCSLTGASSPVVRATVMAGAFLIGHLLRRLPSFSHSLGLAGLFILIADPNELFRLGFQLSFLSVAFIVGLYPKLRPENWLKNRVRVGGWGAHLAYGTASSVVISFAAWLGTAPLLAHVFGAVMPLSVVANLAVVPLAMLATAAGFTLLAAGLILPPAAPFFGVALQGLLGIFLRVNFALAGCPGAVWAVGMVPGWFVLILYMCIVVGAGLVVPQEVA